MDIRLTGTGGPGGWPEPGCGCASCARERRRGRRREPSGVVVDGVLRLTPARVPGIAEPASVAGYRLLRLTGGWEVTAPDGARLLFADGPGAAPEPPAGAAPYHAVLLDLAGDPAQLGLLRRRRLVADEAVVVAVHIDHRVRSEQELARRCTFWRATVLADGSHLAAPAPGHASAPTAAPTAGRAGNRYLPATPAARAPWRALLLGGARSGKSAEAELRLAAEPDVTYVATGPGPGTDADWASRVAAHRSRRPAWWRTAETLDLAGQLRTASGALLLDGIGTWLAGTMSECGIWAAAGDGSPEGGSPGDAASGRLAGRIADLVGAWRRTQANVVAVSDETGSGVVPATASGRRFRDELGRLNQLLAAESEEAALMVAGRALPLPELSVVLHSLPAARAQRACAASACWNLLGFYSACEEQRRDRWSGGKVRRRAAGPRLRALGRHHPPRGRPATLLSPAADAGNQLIMGR